ncbi:MAG: LysR family transcriptional regulator [Rhodobacteraceae bacterium]|nr:LysR family transcriptional regulator [Paracoccaceae bacterium]
MNIAAIQTFLSVVRRKNLNAAADELNVTQSAVTARLDALEDALGQKLLVRSRKGATMTKAGFAFLEQAEVIVRTWANARAKLGLPRGFTGLFSFVCDPALWSAHGRGWFDAARQDHPGTAFEIWSGTAAQAEGWLQSGMSDAALLTEPLAGPAFASRELLTERIVQVASAPRAARAWDEGYIYVDYGPAIRAQHAEAWPGDETSRLAFSNPDWALAELLKAGGSAYLPEVLAAPHLVAGQLFRVSDAPAFTRRLFLSWRTASAADFPWLAS